MGFGLVSWGRSGRGFFVSVGFMRVFYRSIGNSGVDLILGRLGFCWVRCRRGFRVRR